MYLSATVYEDYDACHWDPEIVDLYTDEQDIGTELVSILLFAEDCLNQGLFIDSKKILDKVLNISVLVIYDENSLDEFDYYFEEMEDRKKLDLEELSSEEIININFYKFTLFILYANYQVNKSKERLIEFYNYFSLPLFRQTRIDEILTIGKDELKDHPNTTKCIFH